MAVQLLAMISLTLLLTILLKSGPTRTLLIVFYFAMSAFCPVHSNLHIPSIIAPLKPSFCSTWSSHRANQLPSYQDLSNSYHSIFLENHNYCPVSALSSLKSMSNSVSVVRQSYDRYVLANDLSNWISS